MSFRTELLKKLFWDRHPFCGRSEFSFRLRPGGQKWRKIYIAAREYIPDNRNVEASFI